mmetsp:Transcript_3366/g.4878  ORF Transcript_3366/g.4878 Transcript_3366/m.4878 type:complete len:94 (+) Transcript_3366:458-739(+)
MQSSSMNGASLIWRRYVMIDDILAPVQLEVRENRGIASNVIFLFCGNIMQKYIQTKPRAGKFSGINGNAFTQARTHTYILIYLLCICVYACTQ